MATHSSTLAWKVPWTEEPAGLQSVGLQSQTRLNMHVTLCHVDWSFLVMHLPPLGSLQDGNLTFMGSPGMTPTSSQCLTYTHTHAYTHTDYPADSDTQTHTQTCPIYLQLTQIHTHTRPDYLQLTHTHTHTHTHTPYLQLTHTHTHTCPDYLQLTQSLRCLQHVPRLLLCDCQKSAPLDGP